MILEDETFKAYGYYASKLKLESNKLILVACNECKKVRTVQKNDYRGLCRICAHKGKKGSMFGKTGKKHPKWKPKVKCICLWCGKEFEVQRSFIRKSGGKYCCKKCNIEDQKGKNQGENNPNFKGGKRTSRIRAGARRRKLGYTLLLPLKEGEVGHHVTNEYVVGIPKDVHEKLSGYSRKKHRTKVLMWLKAHNKKKYKLVLWVLAKE